MSQLGRRDEAVPVLVENSASCNGPALYACFQVYRGSGVQTTTYHRYGKGLEPFGESSFCLALPTPSSMSWSIRGCLEAPEPPEEPGTDPGFGQCGRPSTRTPGAIFSAFWTTLDPGLGTLEKTVRGRTRIRGMTHSCVDLQDTMHQLYIALTMNKIRESFAIEDNKILKGLGTQIAGKHLLFVKSEFV